MDTDLSIAATTTVLWAFVLWIVPSLFVHVEHFLERLIVGDWMVRMPFPLPLIYVRVVSELINAIPLVVVLGVILGLRRVNLGRFSRAALVGVITLVVFGILVHTGYELVPRRLHPTTASFFGWILGCLPVGFGLHAALRISRQEPQRYGNGIDAHPSPIV